MLAAVLVPNDVFDGPKNVQRNLAKKFAISAPTLGFHYI